MAFEMPRVSKPEDVGFSSQRLQRMRDAFQADIDTGIVPGAVVLVARHGKVACFEALGRPQPAAGLGWRLFLERRDRHILPD